MKRISLLILSLLFFATAFQSDKLVTSGWTLQILPNLNGAQISDVTFLDSLTGFYVTNDNVAYDTSYILKTTNGGNNWIIKNIHIGGFNRIVFVDSLIGYACGGTNSGTSHLYKTTDRGENWSLAYAPSTAFWRDLSVINKDTMWLTDDDGLIGGIFRTTNGGISWANLFYAFNQNPDKIYMVNKNLGFISRDQSYEGRTTNGGLNWTIQSEDSTFRYMRFVDSLTGWKSFVNVKKTTDGGITWFNQVLPTIPNVETNGKIIVDFTSFSKDTVFGGGGYYRDKPSSPYYTGIIYKTTNGGTNWGYQIPDTSFRIARYWFVKFIDKNKGWAFQVTNKCIRTTTGGSDTTFFTGIKHVPSIVPEKYSLGQNYPNPFNPATNIPFELKEPSHVTLKVFDARGREVKELVNGRWGTGKFIADFDASALATGIYFYQIIVSGETTKQTFSETKKMLMIK